MYNAGSGFLFFCQGYIVISLNLVLYFNSDVILFFTRTLSYYIGATVCSLLHVLFESNSKL